MPHAHICLDCGTDLARVRAGREPAYGLMIVRCPDCATVVVRRRHPLAQLWRRFRGLDLAVTVLLVNLAALIILVGNSVAAAVWVADQQFSLATMPVDQKLTIVWAVLLLPLLVGTWLTAGLPHWRRPVAWATFFGLAAGVLLASLPLLLFVRWLRLHAGMTVPEDAVVDFGRTVAVAFGVLAVMMVVATIGIGPGLGIRWGLRSVMRAVRRWRRRRQRLERMR